MATPVILGIIAAVTAYSVYVISKAGGGKVEGPRLTDSNFTVSTYGNSIPLTYGRARIPGNAIWMSPLRERVTVEEQGGKGGGKGGVTTTTYSYDVDVAIAVCQGERTIRRIWANKKLIFSEGTLDSERAEAIRLYTGTNTQLPDPLIEADLGMGNTPGFVNTVYAVFQTLQLADFGNAMPNFEFEVDGGPVDYFSVLSDLSDRCGLVRPSDYVVHPLLAAPVIEGYAIETASTTADAILPLQLPGQFDTIDHHGHIRYQPRGRSVKGTMSIGETAGHDADAEAGFRFEIARQPEAEMPRRVSINYPDRDRELQPSSQSAERTGTDALDERSVDVPVAMSDAEARKAADRSLQEEWVRRNGFRLTTNWGWEFLTASDKIALEVGDYYEMLLVNSIERGDNGVLRLEGVFDDRTVYDGAITGAPAPQSPFPLLPPGASLVYVFCAPRLQQQHSGTVSYYALFPANGETSSWPGASVFWSLDEMTWQLAPQELGGPASSVGEMQNTLGNYIDYCPFEDNTNTISVEMIHGELSSATNEQLAMNNNVAWVGRADGSQGEVIQFRDATLEMDGTYTLSGLFRGLRGTEDERSMHVAGEVFVLLNSAVRLLDFGGADFFEARYYKAVTIFVPEATVGTQQEYVSSGCAQTYVEGCDDSVEDYGSPGNVYVAEVLADNPVAYYRLGEPSGTTLVDEINSPTQDGSVTSSGDITLGVAGAIAGDSDTAISKTGSDGGANFLEVPITLDFTTNDGMAIEGWFVWNNDGVMLRDNTSSAGTGTFMLLNSGGNVRVVVDGESFVTSLVSATYADGQYHHWVLEYVHSGPTINVYVDGALGDTVNISARSGTSVDFFRMFRNGATSNPDASGTADEIAFYNAPLGLARVSAHYNAGT